MFGLKKSRPESAHPTSIRLAFPVTIARPAPEVWALLRNPEHTVRYRDDVVSAVTMPNSGEGVGEVQAILYRQHGRFIGSFIEIVEYEPGRRAVHRNLNEVLPVQLREALTETFVEPISDDRTQLTHAVLVTAATGYVLTPDIVEGLTSHYAAFWNPVNQRVRDELERDGSTTP